MPTRTRRDEVTFRRPFRPAGAAGPSCPAGAWVVETEEELLQMLSFPAWRRTRTTIRLRDPAPGRLVQTIPVDPAALAAARVADAAPPIARGGAAA